MDLTENTPAQGADASPSALDREEQSQTYQRQWKKADYDKNPEKYRERSRARRRVKGGEINAQRRKRAAEKREQEAAARLAAYQQNPPDRNLPPNEQLRLWLEAKGWTARKLAREVGVSPRSVFDWLSGKHPPEGERRRRLWRIAGLDCFEPIVRVTVPEKRPPAGSEKTAAALLKALVFDNGLSPREILRRGVWEAEAKGVRTPTGCFIPWGDGLHKLPKKLFDEWVRAAQPRDHLFFRYKNPVGRDQPSTVEWVVRRLREAGVPVRGKQAVRTFHFAADFLHLGHGQRFLRHLGKDHGISKTHCRALLERFTARKVSLRDSGLKGEAITPESLVTGLEKRGRGGRRKLALEERRFAQITQAVEQWVPQMGRGIAILRESKKKNPPAEATHREQLRKAGFNPEQIGALLASNTAIGAAQRYVAVILKDSKHREGLLLQTVQSACARYRRAKITNLLA